MKLEYKKDFKHILKNLRLKKGFSQTQITQILGVSLSAYTKYEQGKNTPSLTVLLKICDFFEKDISYFLKSSEIAKGYVEKVKEILDNEKIDDENNDFLLFHFLKSLNFDVIYNDKGFFIQQNFIRISTPTLDYENEKDPNFNKFLNSLRENKKYYKKIDTDILKDELSEFVYNYIHLNSLGFFELDEINDNENKKDSD